MQATIKDNRPITIAIAVIHVCSNHAISEFYTRIITFDQLAKQKECSSLGIINIQNIHQLLVKAPDTAQCRGQS